MYYKNVDGCDFTPHCSVQRNSDSTSAQMDDLAKLLSYKINQMANYSNKEEAKRSTLQRTLTPQEVKLYLTFRTHTCIHCL